MRETKIRKKSWRIRLRGIENKFSKKASPFLPFSFEEEELNRFPGIYALHTSQNWLNSENEITSQDLITKLYDTAEAYFSNYARLLAHIETLGNRPTARDVSRETLCAVILILDLMGEVGNAH